MDLPGTAGTFTGTEKYAKGHFSTFAGQSPGACEGAGGAGGAGHTVIEGISGTFKGSIALTITNGVFNPNGACVRDANGFCTRGGWVHGFFGDNASVSQGPTFNFVYKASSQGLVSHQWTNADTGNIGDIAST